MSLPRVRRADRLVELRGRAVDAALGELAKAAARTLESEALARDAEARWESAVTVASAACGSAADVGGAHAYLQSLRQRADGAAVAVRVARADEETRRLAVAAARTEHRKLELWRDGLLTAERAGAERLERRASDEVAARIARRP